MRRRLPPERLDPDRSSDAGLTEAAVDAMRQRFGPNEILETPPRRWRDELWAVLKDPMIGFLGATSAIYLGLGQKTEAALLFFAVVPLVAMDALLHRRTRASTEGLRARLSTTALAIRNGTPKTIRAQELVVGDLVRVSPGELFPADGVIRSGDSLLAEESVLTGESFPVRKAPLPPPALHQSNPLVDGRHWALAGTRLLTGIAEFQVVFVGRETLYGEIVQSATSGIRERTPLQRQVASLVGVLVVAASIFCLVLGAVRWGQGYGLLDALVSAATLAIAALPEEFPVALTFFLGTGIYRLARRQALVRRAVTVENVGRVTVICSDKTGTLTEGRLSVGSLLPSPVSSEEELLFTAVLASRRESQDPLDTALFARVDAGTRNPPGARAVATFPFTEARRKETRVVQSDDGATLAAVKGSPEVVFDLCALTGPACEYWKRSVDALSSQAQKVVACAHRPIDLARWAGDEPERGFTLAGLVGFEDPVRPGVSEALLACRNAGIHVLMVTGDHPETARAVAARIGLGSPEPVVVSGDELQGLIESGNGHPSRRLDVVARAVPAQKLALVRAFQRANEIVAVTGDGVNDVPALQAADVGIAMGERGTRSAREVASIVLLDDNFRTLVRAISEGRQLFQNLRMSFLYLLAMHIPLVITAAAIPLAGYPLLYLPIHIIWLELIIHPTALLAFQREADPNHLARQVPQRAGSLFTAREWLSVSLSGGLATALILTGYAWAFLEHREVAHARALAMAALTTASAVFSGLLTRFRSWLAAALAVASLAVSIVLVQLPVPARLLGLQPLHWADWSRVLAAAVTSSLPLLLVRARGRP